MSVLQLGKGMNSGLVYVCQNNYFGQNSTHSSGSKAEVILKKMMCAFSTHHFTSFSHRQQYIVSIQSTYICRKKYGTGHVTLATSLPGLPVAVDSESVLQSSQVITPRLMISSCQNSVVITVFG